MSSLTAEPFELKVSGKIPLRLKIMVLQKSFNLIIILVTSSLQNCSDSYVFYYLGYKSVSLRFAILRLSRTS